MPTVCWAPELHGKRKHRPQGTGVDSMMEFGCGLSGGDETLYLPGDWPGPWKDQRDALYFN